MSKQSPRPTTARSPRRSRYCHHHEILQHQHHLQQQQQQPQQPCRLTPFAQRSMGSKSTPSHLQPFTSRPSPQDEIMEVQGLPIV